MYSVSGFGNLDPSGYRSTADVQLLIDYHTTIIEGLLQGMK